VKHVHSDRPVAETVNKKIAQFRPFSWPGFITFLKFKVFKCSNSQTMVVQNLLIGKTYKLTHNSINNDLSMNRVITINRKYHL